ncbi:transporter substrate-binding domain-containing protein [Rhizobium wuzhouense]|uniref:Amino acid ABC transporter n=1 Tax=Rhizobium wuzhouense TaxID=1986026 RepID=A0ABX5NWS9_9HYPH|nr:transporter substrate-binding domain-containing protein [Rhizobium wuzhouense]PYB77642.1 amino acid ABC transporter [Rhizobium wuzhouense]
MRVKVTSLDFAGLCRRIAAFALVLPLLAPVPAGAQAETAGQPADLPVLFDARERLVRPDISGMLRLRFLTTTDFPPFNFTDQADRLSGFHIDLARAICEELSMQARCQIQALPYEQLADALDAGQGEAVLAGVAVTPELRKRFRFTRPYLLLPARFLVARDRKLARPDAESLFGRPVGVVENTAHAAMLKAFFPDIRAVPFKDRDSLMQALTDKRIDAVFADALQSSFWMQSPAASNCCAFLGGAYLSESHLGEGMTVMVAGKDQSLAAALESALAMLSKNGRLEEIYLRYFPAGLY